MRHVLKVTLNPSVIITGEMEGAELCVIMVLELELELELCVIKLLELELELCVIVSAMQLRLLLLD